MGNTLLLMVCICSLGEEWKDSVVKLVCFTLQCEVIILHAFTISFPEPFPNLVEDHILFLWPTAQIGRCIARSAAQLRKRAGLGLGGGMP
jgi:hypothetical protein